MNGVKKNWIGVLGGMGPAATVDFMDKLVRLTPAARDQDHLPLLVVNQPHVPDRSSNILGKGADPLPYLLESIDLLNEAQVSLVVITCNTAHHWYDALSAHCRAPILHIARACVSALPPGAPTRVAIFATRGAIQSGVYQRELGQRNIPFVVPEPEGAQQAVDACIRAVKGGDMQAGVVQLGLALDDARARGAQAVILGCTELPVAAQHLAPQPLQLIDSTLELARQTVKHALYLGWNRPSWLATPDPAVAASVSVSALPAPDLGVANPLSHSSRKDPENVQVEQALADNQVSAASGRT